MCPAIDSDMAARAGASVASAGNCSMLHEMHVFVLDDYYLKRSGITHKHAVWLSLFVTNSIGNMCSDEETKIEYMRLRDTSSTATANQVGDCRSHQGTAKCTLGFLVMCPMTGSSAPLIRPSRVDLPMPLGPTMAARDSRS